MAKRSRWRVRTKLKRVLMWSISNFAHVNESSIFILGNQKSGTTIASKLLAQCTGLSATHDIVRAINSKASDRLAEGRISFPDYVKKFKLEFSKDIIKEGGLTIYYPQLVSLFPNAQYVMIIRDPRSNIRSILSRYNIDGRETSVEPYWDKLGKAWQRNFNGEWAGIPTGNMIESLAYRWNHITNMYFEHSDRFVLFKYEDFVSSKESEIIQLARRLGLSPKFDISDHVNVQYQPRSDHSISVEEFFGERNLKTIKDLCSRNMKKLGYLADLP